MGCFPFLGVFGKAFSVGRNLTWHRHSLPCVEPRRQGERGASWGSLDEKGAHDTARDTRRGLEAARNGWGDVGRYAGFRMSWLCGALALRGIVRCPARGDGPGVGLWGYGKRGEVQGLMKPRCSSRWASCVTGSPTTVLHDPSILSTRKAP